ncbi:DUF1622 domain-containing protein [Bradyrhizobium sp. WU425]|uniref:DUF1622 domain-containing protein n=1 Tax=Bradyrhizobium sp. WU425 TaxID=187029 RepID=UPI001E2AA32A|nr:DUF1622 domain-containing protein [Bradyrhizobium canariense]UFW72977.1 DUF1622 domain-containing protein [Bradyrhizobium canariense]
MAAGQDYECCGCTSDHRRAAGRNRPYLFALRQQPDGRLFRQDTGRPILLGLEVLVAADIIRTVAVTPTPTSVAVLAGVMLIRTFLSFSLEVAPEAPFRGRKGPRGARAKHQPGPPPPGGLTQPRRKGQLIAASG